MILVSAETTEKRKTFFKYIFGTAEGYICLARRRQGTKIFEEDFFRYPDELHLFLSAINRYSQDHDLWYCPHTFSKRTRQKEFVLRTPSAWSDLDVCEPSRMLVKPSFVVESSPRRYQALWVFDEIVEPVTAEEISRRIAYFHADNGADKSGWDLTQLLRVPFTYNHKYAAPTSATPIVMVIEATATTYNSDDFNIYPTSEGSEYLQVPFPETLPGDASEVLLKYRHDLHPHAYHLFSQQPKEDWSKALWALQMLLFESGLDRDEVFVVAKEASCNKYERDNRSDKLLWKEVCRAASKYQERTKVEVEPDAPLDPLLSDEERKWVTDNPCLVEEYVEWGKSLGDAAWQYHQAGAFVVLSTLLAGSLRLPTSYGLVIPNLWFMILADTTLTRKTTAMDLAIDLLSEIDPDCILATDGSIEGLFTSLGMRPGRPSIFLRDEFSGLLDSMTKKDYYAGMAETLTKLYDGKFQKRVLRKEVIEVRDPVLILFAGGIKSRVLQLLTFEHVSSGFLPRFVFITAESDISKLRPLGPPSEASIGKRQELVQNLTKLYEFYKSSIATTVNGKVVTTERTWDALLTDDAWARYNQFESSLLASGLASMHSDVMTPAMDRLAKSGLKVAVLLAAIRNQGDIVTVEEQDIVRAFAYVESWRIHEMEVIKNIGKSASEKLLDQVYRAIEREPGAFRSMIMRNYHLNRRDTDLILDTLEQRNLINRVRAGKGERLYPIGAFAQ